MREQPAVTPVALNATPLRGRRFLLPPVKPALLVLCLFMCGEAAAGQDDTSTVTVSPTHISRPVQEEPTHVEVAVADSQLSPPPLTLAGLLGDVRGVRVEATSAALGSMTIRLHGHPGHQTAMLTDGLPLLPVRFGGLGMGQVAPLDVRHAEVVHGAASALYGPSALGGVVNLVSRLPGDGRELVLNETSQAGTDVVGWYSKRGGERWGLTVTGGVHRQAPQDVDADAWADVVGARRVALRPRLFVNTPRGGSLLLTVGGMSEFREGGTLPDQFLADGQAFATASNANRVDGGLVAVIPTALGDTLTVRASASTQWQRQDLGPASPYSTQHGRHRTTFTEATLAMPRTRATWLLGVGYEQDGFHSPDLTGFDYAYFTPSVFAQTTFALGAKTILTTSGRCDLHSELGLHCSPRIVALVRAPGSWRVRLTGAVGFSAPTPFVDETEGVQFARMVPFGSQTMAACNPSLCAIDSGDVQITAPFSIRVETARYASVDVTGRAGPVAVTATLFGSIVDDPLILWDLNLLDERPHLLNADGPTRTAGAELSASVTRGTVRVELRYLYMRSTMLSPGRGRVEPALTPRHSGALEVRWESQATNTGVALHAEYTGSQAVFDDPYRSVSPPYTTVGMHAVKRLGAAELYVAGENLTDVRQTRYDPLVVRVIDDKGRRTTDVWAPLAGRVISVGMRVGF